MKGRRMARKPAAALLEKKGVSLMKKKSWSQDIIIAILLLALSTFLIFHAITVQSAEARQFPILILLIFAALAAAMLVNGIRDSRAPEDGTPRFKNMKWEEIKYPMVVFAFIVIYVIAVDLVGFILPSLLFTAGLMWFNYARNKLALILVPCGLVGFLYVLFTFILKTKMP